MLEEPPAVTARGGVHDDVTQKDAPATGHVARQLPQTLLDVVLIIVVRHQQMSVAGGDAVLMR